MRAKRAFIRANKSQMVDRERIAASLASAFHLERHRVAPFDDHS
jgi:hypothetical protein